MYILIAITGSEKDALFQFVEACVKTRVFFIRNAHTYTVHSKRIVTLSTVQNIKIKQLDYFSAE